MYESTQPPVCGLVDHSMGEIDKHRWMNVEFDWNRLIVCRHDEYTVGPSGRDPGTGSRCPRTLRNESLVVHLFRTCITRFEKNVNCLSCMLMQKHGVE